MGVRGYPTKVVVVGDIEVDVAVHAVVRRPGVLDEDVVAAIVGPVADGEHAVV